MLKMQPKIGCAKDRPKCGDKSKTLSRGLVKTRECDSKFDMTA